ncbi:MAG TPA: hypothetical protein PLI58_02495 [Candidatus Syntrophosphaera sp.]|jgi:hypothetical protein|nr:hypothetical protein [Candidatus Syntrophosphaera sp.]HQG93876.1 hypothetical protein [Candidatus Syntrophosphaera sp.]HQK28993.1 hypothetical protein [Candidatus Syntrophosphaera sp.]
MKKIVLLFVVLSILFLTSCSIIGINSVTSKTKDIYGSVIHLPVVVDLIVQNTKITKEFTTECPQNPTDDVIEDVKSIAIAAALKEHSADVLIEPNYDVQITSKSASNSEIKVVVTGYPATYKNFRNATKGDVELIEGTTNIRMLPTANN